MNSTLNAAVIDSDHGQESEDSCDSAATLKKNSQNVTAAPTATTHVIAKSETRHVNVIRGVTALVLVSAAVAVSAAVYVYASRVENDNFQTEFAHHGGKVADGFTANARNRLAVMNQMARSFSRQAEMTNQSFPFVTIRNLEEQSIFVSELAQVIGFAIHPIVSEEQTGEWAEYVEKEQSWLTRELAWQASTNLVNDKQNEINVLDQAQEWLQQNELPTIAPFPADIYKIEEGQVMADPGPGQYAPTWQLVPALSNSLVYNYNALSRPGSRELFQSVIQEKKLALSRVIDFSNDTSTENNLAQKTVINLMLEKWRDTSSEYQDGPFVDLVIPIFDRLAGAGPSGRKVGALLLGFLYWQVYFQEILAEGTNGVIVVLRNTCDQAFTYQLDGEDVTYIGGGDLHDPQFDDMAIQTKWDNFVETVTSTVETNSACDYRISVYPSETFRDEYITRWPILFAVILSAVFIFTSCIFLLYDCLVQRRHRVVNNTAVKSNAVVTSLFPDEVRGRLDAAFDESIQNDSHVNPMEVRRDAASGPIADLYPNCTVLFADISGFTRWSSSRSPTDVFRLLEALYGAFDKSARIHKVFKIETIGDCYVAATGLPQPQQNHAVIMCRFANDCISRMHEILPNLCDRLGSETSTLSMRFGLHSGPVTAGVLRGEKARFQLFGDTVNVAARMESNGERGRIHVSQETADVLVTSGKSAWVSERKDRITAKGKGELVTFWVNPTISASSSGHTVAINS